MRRCHTEADLRQSHGHVVVMDLGHWPEAEGRTFDELKEAIPQMSSDENSRLDQLASERVQQVISILPQTTALIVYVRSTIYSLNPLKGGTHHFAIANMPISLVGMVADAAYVVFAEQKQG